MELFKIQHKGPRGGERFYVLADGFADVERFIQRRRLEGAKFKRLAVDYAFPWLVDARKANGTGAAVPEAVSLPARYGARIERLKQNFRARTVARGC